jgi:hypothetical protein
VSNRDHLREPAQTQTEPKRKRIPVLLRQSKASGECNRRSLGTDLSGKSSRFFACLALSLSYLRYRPRLLSPRILSHSPSRVDARRNTRTQEPAPEYSGGPSDRQGQNTIQYSPPPALLGGAYGVGFRISVSSPSHPCQTHYFGHLLWL